MTGKFSCLVLLFCFLSLCSSAQKNLKEAIVVFNNVDTTRGFIDYKEWFTNPVSVLFTTDKNIAVARYTVAELNYFEITGVASYQRHTVKVGLSDDALSNAGEEDTSSETRTVFLKLWRKAIRLPYFLKKTI